MLKAILFNDTSYNKHHGCQIVVEQIYRLAAAAGIHIIKACPMRHDWRNDRSLQREISGVDLCLINGEGTLHDDARAAQMLVELAPFCRERGVSCFLINSVWQRNEKLLEPTRAFTGIYLRDHMSQRELAASGLSSQVVPDLTLSRPQPPSSPERSGFLVNGSFYEDRTQEAWRAYRQAADPSLRYLSIHTVPQLQFGKGFPVYFWRSLRSRFKAWRSRLTARFERLGDEISRQQIKVVRGRYCATSASRFLAQLADSEGVISGRFHCITLCLLTETPFFAIGSNTHKIEALLDACGLQKRIYPDYASALADRGHIAFSEDELLAVRRFIRDSRLQAEQMFAAIAQSVASARTERALGR